MAESLDVLKYQDPGIYGVEDTVGLSVNLPPPEFLITIVGEDEKNPIARIKPDGTVIVNKLGADEEAAKIFWNAMQIYGKSIVQQREEETERAVKAENLLDKLRLEKAALHAENEDLRAALMVAMGEVVPE